MKNNLERFIRDNREAFDADEPPMDFWARIEPGITQPEPIQRPLNGKPFGGGGQQGGSCKACFAAVDADREFSACFLESVDAAVYRIEFLGTTERRRKIARRLDVVPPRDKPSNESANTRTDQG